MSNWQVIDKFGIEGMKPDLMPTHRAPGALDLAENCRPVGSNLRLAGGYAKLGDLQNQPSTLFFEHAFGTNVLYAAGSNSIYAYTTELDWGDITDEAFTLAPTEPGQPCGRWSGGYMMGVMVFSNCNVNRWYKFQPDETEHQQLTPLLWNKLWDLQDPPGDPTLTWEEMGVSCAVMRPWKNFMFAGNVTNTSSSEYWPQQVIWSHPCSFRTGANAEANWSPPERWEATDPTSLAGNVHLAETPGVVVDLVPLRDQLIVYKSDAIYSVDFLSGNKDFVFKFRHVLSNRGVAGQDAVVEYNGLHYCQGIEDIFVFDGNTAQSIIWGLAKRYYLLDRDSTKAFNNFTSINPKHEEILFHYCSVRGSGEWPDKTMAYCLATKAWTVRNYGTQISHSIWQRSMASVATADWQLYTVKQSGYDLVDLETGTTRDGSSIPVTISRNGLFADPGHQWVQVDAVKVGLIADNGQTFSMRLGGQVSPSAPITWRSKFTVDPSTDYKTDTRQNDNYIAWELTASVTDHWQLANVDLLVQGSGKRG